ncbi:hypothetical protein [Candidatus Methylacidiphilum infernorum]|uniref:hypothetical protein n=1 Tax=Candidatus Methylacidiphilum infernorum TaxID=511746 RepID=UPI001F5C3C00|nr:hypothetical protein [Candidatus Methylacidiphilum infernorum]
MNEKKRIELTAHQGKEEKLSADVHSFDHVPLNLAYSEELTSPRTKDDGAKGAPSQQKEKKTFTQQNVFAHKYEFLNVRALPDLKTIGETKAVAKQRLEQAVLSASDPEKMDHEKLKAFLEKNNKRIRDKDWTGLAQRIEEVVEQKKAEDIPAYWKLPGIGKGKGPLFPESFWQKACECKKRVEELEKQREEAPLFKAEGLTPNPFPGVYHSPTPELEQKKIREKQR